MKKLFKLLSIALAAGAFSTVQAQSSWYKAAPAPSGGAVSGLHTDNAGKVFASTSYTSSIFYTADNGLNWTAVPGTQPFWNLTCFALNKATDAIYVGTDYAGLYYTTDGGGTWTPIPFAVSPVSGLSPAVDAVTTKPGTNIVVCACGGVIYRSYTGGTYGSWFVNSTSFSPSTTGFTYLASDTLLMASSDGVYRSATDGNTWTASNIGLSNFVVLEIAEKTATHKIFAAVPYNGNTSDTTGCGVFVSVDGGHTWENTSTGITDLRITHITLNTITGDLYAVAPTGVYQSVDDGDTWVAVNTGLVTGDLRCITDNNTGVFVGSTANGVAYAAAPATGWNYRNKGMYIADNTAFCISDTGDMHMIDMGHGGLYHYNSGDWAQQNNGISLVPASILGNDVVEDKNGILYSSFSRGLSASFEGFFKSTDNGASWTAINTIPWLTGDNPTFTQMKLDKNNNLYVGVKWETGGNRILQVFRSCDQGTTWGTVCNIDTASYLDLTDITLAGDSTVYLKIINDFGDVTFLYAQHWNTTFTPLPVDAGTGYIPSSLVCHLKVGPDDSVYIPNNNKVYKSDGMGNWRELTVGGWDTTNPSENPINLYIDTLNNMYVTCNNFGVYYSDDHGVTWVNISAGLPMYTPPPYAPALTSLYDIRFDKNNVPYALAYGNVGAVDGIYKYGIPPISVSAPNISPEAKNKVAVYPNPVTSISTIELTLQNPSNTTMKLYNVAGQLVRDLSAVRFQPGVNYIPLNMNGFTPGIYMLETITDGKKNMVKVAKQ